MASSRESGKSGNRGGPARHGQGKGSAPGHSREQLNRSGQQLMARQVRVVAATVGRDEVPVPVVWATGAGVGANARPNWR